MGCLVSVIQILDLPMKPRITTRHFLLMVLVGLLACSDPVTETETEYTGDGVYSLSDSKGGSFSGSGGSGNGDSTTQYQPGIITAGEWNDNLHWGFWKDLLSTQEYAEGLSAWGLNPVSRMPIKLEDSFGRSLIDATVEIRNNIGKVLWKCRTDNFGKAATWPKLFNPNDTPAELVVHYSGKSFTYPAHTFNENQNNISVPIVRDQLNEADIGFVVDATGSMGDELEYLKVELNDVLVRAAQNNCSSWRLGSVFYRDTGDEYITRVSPFTTNASIITNFIKDQRAEGGGDWPEAVHNAMDDALNQLNWSAQARARLLFLVLDAPPHEEEAIISGLKQQIIQAAEKGIKIIPVVASGIDKDTEFLMRSWSLVTNGTYVFITDHSGVGNDHLEPTVGDYTVEKLNDLMVRLIYQYTSCTSE